MPLIQGRNPYIDDEELCGDVDLDGICGRPPLHDGWLLENRHTVQEEAPCICGEPDGTAHGISGWKS